MPDLTQAQIEACPNAGPLVIFEVPSDHLSLPFGAFETPQLRIPHSRCSDGQLGGFCIGGRMMKRCAKCRQAKPETGFNRHSGRPDGLQSYCRACSHEAERARRISDPEGSRARGRTRRLRRRSKCIEESRVWRQENTEAVREYDARYHQEHAEECRARSRRYDSQYPARAIARRRTRTARKNGGLIRPGICTACRESCRPDAHHEDYSKPLDVLWLCHRCHQRLHRLEEQSDGTEWAQRADAAGDC